jgi:glycosyltransferase involved in cell wall biosynthesis
MTTRLNIGITCFPTFGGSGIVATEIGLAMARRGHKVHFISRALPVRLHPATDGVYFHEVTESAHPVLEPGGAYPLALASKIIEVAGYEKLDLLHVHYAVPHATAAFLARQVLGASAPRLVTTLHGTDITLVGSDPSYLPITRFSVQQSDAVTVPSAFLREETRQRLGEQEPVLFHVSNFRPIKRVADVVATLAAVNAQVPSRLVLVGDGPERSAIERKVHDLGLGERVCFLGKQERFEAWLAAADVFVLPSETESFGLAALEALSCGVPVVAADVGGLPEVVTHGVTGWLAPVGDVATFSQRVLDLVRNPQSWQAMSRAARADVLARFQRGPAIDAYEGVYRRVLGQ